MNGWYVVYMIVCFLNSFMLTFNGFGIRTWQFWAWLTLITLAYVAGKNS